MCYWRLTLVLWQVAVLVTSAANATLLANLAPVWVGLSAYLLRERLGLYFWPGLMLALATATLVQDRSEWKGLVDASAVPVSAGSEI